MSKDDKIKETLKIILAPEFQVSVVVVVSSVVAKY